MKKAVVSLLLIFFTCVVNSQQRVVDSLKQHLPTTNDTMALVLYQLLNDAYSEINDDSAIHYANSYTAISQTLHYEINYADGLRRIAASSEAKSSKELDLLLKAEQILEVKTSGKIPPSSYLDMIQIPRSLHSFQMYSKFVAGKVMQEFSILYWSNRKYYQAHEQAIKALEIANELQTPELLVWGNFGLAVFTENSDSSLMYYKNSRDISLRTGYIKALGVIYDFMAKEYANRKEYDQQLYYLRASLQHYLEHELVISTGWGYLGLGEFYIRSKPNTDSALFYVRKAYDVAVRTNSSSIEYWSSKDLYDIYKASGDKDSVFRYVEIMLVARETVFNEDLAMQFENADYNQELQREAIEKANEKLKNRVRLYSFLAGIGVLLLLVIIFWRNSKRRQKEYALLQKQKQKTEQALTELKSTQAQLIQSEKMASLGELTAGIAHEIQNPLNFVNNFSEVSTELIDEMKEELSKGNNEDAVAIAEDVKQNLEKILNHGKRADAIVKGMLQHSRTSSGQKELTDINVLADEYLRLAFHGLRAKDKSFNAKFETDFDPTVEKINVVPQEIGRVILNLINNAFYAVNEKKRHASTGSAPDGYEPVVTVSTRKTIDKILISVKDNGIGIPQKAMDKIFQPFFTTKPTGQGTGLGLSLAYDIVKAHGGELMVKTKEGEGSEFMILLPG